jgi:drug/metabolite transporter, DME family
MNSPFQGSARQLAVPSSWPMKIESAPKPRNDARTGYLLVILAATTWSLIGVIATKARRLGIEPLEISFWRAAIGGALFVIHAAVRAEKRPARSDTPGVAMLGLIGVAAFYVCFNLATTTGGVSLAAVLLYSAPAFVTLLAWPMLGEAITRSKLAIVATVLVGVGFVAASGGSGLHVSATSVFWGLAAGLSYSSIYVLGKPLFTRSSAVGVYALAMPLGAVVLLPFVAFHHKSAGAWAWLLVLGALSTYGGHLAYGRGIARIEASRGVVVATLEPVLALVWGATFFGERFGVLGLAGSACIVAGSLFSALPNQRH